MKRNALTLLLLCLTLAIRAIDHEPYNQSRIFWDTSTRTTVFNSGGYSRMIQLQDGRLMAVTESGGIQITFSSNGGTTWDSPTKIVNNPSGISECVPDLIQLSDGTIIVAYNPRPHSPYSEERKFGIRCKRSTDNGKTWSQEIFVNDASHIYNDGCWEPSMLELPSGELQLYFADEGPYTYNNDQRISLCRSTDGGLTWSTPENISYRQGYRDGMPVPVLLHDGKTICVAIEDNGWSGFGSFIPTTVRCSLSRNWKRYTVGGGSADRDKMINYDYCPVALGGAPYLRVLPWGETVMSHQSTYGAGENQMWIYMGNEEARDFRDMSSPFDLGSSESCLWNSVAVIDTGVVVAVAGRSGHVEMVKGYPVRRLQAAYGSPKVDGTLSVREGYYKANASQMILGTVNGVRFTADFAYDRDSLYFITRVSDRTQLALGGYVGDGVTLYLDLDNSCSLAPLDGMYRLFFRLDGTNQFWAGNTSAHNYRAATLEGINQKVSTSRNYYTIEAAIPWATLGIDFPPVGKIMRANVEMQDRRTTSDNEVYKEMLPDGDRNQSWTWMEFVLEESEQLGISSPQTVAAVPDFDVVRQGNALTIQSPAAMTKAVVCAADGRQLATYQNLGRSFTRGIAYSGMSVVKVTFAGGATASRKIIL